MSDDELRARIVRLMSNPNVVEWKLNLERRRAATVEPVTFDSMGAPIFAHQLPPEEPSDER